MTLRVARVRVAYELSLICVICVCGPASADRGRQGRKEARALASRRLCLASMRGSHTAMPVLTAVTNASARVPTAVSMSHVGIGALARLIGIPYSATRWPSLPCMWHAFDGRHLSGRCSRAIWMQTTGAVLLRVKRYGSPRLQTPAQDSRSTLGLLYLAAVRDDSYGLEHCQASLDAQE